MPSEQQAPAEPGSSAKTPATGADVSLTLATKKIAGSITCLNCGTELKGPFCYFCGQPDRNFMRFFPVLLRDLMEDLLDLDSRFMRTVKPLLTKPGRLTRDYIEGRRFRYAPPMRIYIFSSIIFFLLAAFLSSDAVSLAATKNDTSAVQIVLDHDGKPPLRRQATNDQSASVHENNDQEQASIQTIQNKEEADFALGQIQFNDQPWNRETNPVDINWLPGWLNDRINDEIEESPHKAEEINKNPNLIIDKVFDILPATMFILLPVVALILKFWYLFAKRYYIEHLIFSLHNHSFLFVSLILILLANVSGDLLVKYGYIGAATACQWAVIAISTWIPLYLLISLRVVYQQSWPLTLGKFAAIGLSYLTLLTLVTSAVAITSFVLL